MPTNKKMLLKNYGDWCNKQVIVRSLSLCIKRQQLWLPGHLKLNLNFLLIPRVLHLSYLLHLFRQGQLLELGVRVKHLEKIQNYKTEKISKEYVLPSVDIKFVVFISHKYKLSFNSEI